MLNSVNFTRDIDFAPKFQTLFSIQYCYLSRKCYFLRDNMPSIYILSKIINEPFRIEIDLMTYDVELEKMTSRTRRYVRAILRANCSSSATNTSRRFWLYLSYAFADLRDVAFIWKFRNSATILSMDLAFPLPFLTSPTVK